MNISKHGEFSNILHVEEDFRAPKEKIFKVWTEPESLKKWFMAEEGFVVTTAEVDLQVDHPYKIGVTPPGGDQEMVISGEFREIAAPDFLNYTWIVAILDGKDTAVTVKFEDSGTGSKIFLTHGEFDTPEQTQLHADGWVGCLTHLNQLLEAS